MKQLINPHIFREYDIRGISYFDLSNSFSKSLGLAYAEMLRGRAPCANRKNLTIAVGKDCRLSSNSYEDAIVSGLIDGGIDVIRLGLCPTPLIYFSLYHLDLDGAIMVTASHNPPDYNGFKVCVGKNTIYGSNIQLLRNIIESGPKPIKKKGSQSYFDIIPTYQNYLINQFQDLKKVARKKKIIVDCGNGMASIVAPKVFRELGIEVIELYCDLDGTFPNHHPDPTEARNLIDLVKAVKKHSASFGVSYDGDADRLGVVNGDGRLILGDELMFIYTQAILKEKKESKIISEVNASSSLFTEIKKQGGTPIMWKVGHSHLKAKMKETGALLGGGLSGHFCFADRYFGFDDAIYATLRLLELTSETQETLSLLLNDLPFLFSTPEIRIPFEDQVKFKLVSLVKEVLKEDINLNKYRFNEIDGIRIDFKDGWGHVRASNTQPSLSLRFEAKSEKRLTDIKQIFEKAINKICQKMYHSPVYL